MAPEELTAADAARSIARLEGLHDALRARTSAIAWMIWAVAAMGIYVNYSFVGVVVDAYEPRAASMFSIVWFPWVAMALVATGALYRSVGLVVPMKGNWRQGAYTALLFLAFMWGGMTIAERMDVVEPAAALGLMGIVGLTLGITGLGSNHPTDQRLWALTGAIFLLATLALWWPTRGDPDLAYAVFGSVGPYVTGATYFGNGIWRLLRA